MRSLLPTLFCFAMPTLLVGQGVVPPFTIQQQNTHASLCTPAVPGTGVQQVHMVHLPSDPPQVFLCGLTISGLPAANGGVGGTDLLSGKYDALTDTFTPDLDAAALNASGTEFGLTFHPNGLHCVFDRLPGPPQLASRPNTNSPFVMVGPITGLASQSYYDPALAVYQGQPHLVHVLLLDIAMTPINLATGAVSGASVLLVRGAQLNSTANSPSPICDSAGEIIGLSHHDVLSNDNDHYLSVDLDPNTPSVLFNDTSTWTNNGGFAGGRFFDAEYTPSPYHVFSIDSYWFTGGRASIGSNMEVRAFAPPTTSNDVWLSYVLGSTQFAAAPIPIPGVGGMLGLNMSMLIALSMPAHNNANGESLLVIAVPNNPALVGNKIPAQSITVQLGTGQMAFGNTAQLFVQ